MDPWLEAARHYASLDEAGRQRYWSSLTAEQQAALRAALSAPGQTSPAPAMARAEEQIVRPGVLATLSIGCGGFILGIVLTVAFEALLVAAGLQGVRSLVSPAIHGGGSDGAPSTPVIACSQYPEDSPEKRECLDTFHRTVEENTHPEEEPQ